MVAACFPCALAGQNLITNGSMTSAKGENVTAPGWHVPPSEFPNTPDVNDENGALRTTSGYKWTGIPLASPDGGTWQNVFGRESFRQEITGLTAGATYYFRYYYTSQGIQTGNVLQFVTPAMPFITIDGGNGYADPADAGVLYEWNTYSGTITATAGKITITASSRADTYHATDDISVFKLVVLVNSSISAGRNVILLP